LAKILVVEDEFIQFLSLEDLMLARGHEVCGPASTSAEAIEMVLSERPGLVLMDVSIQGGRDGIDTAREIGERFGIPVILTTGYDNPEVYEKARSVKTAGFFLKPYEVDDLMAAIEASITKT
jgi:two-component system, response regulator PdtaR